MTVMAEVRASESDTASSRVVLKNTALNLIGKVLPVLVGLLTAPGTLHRLGIERYAVLNLCWVTVGYFGVFDLGLGRAVTYAVARRFADGTEQIGDIVWPALRLSLALGLLGTVVLFVVGPWIGGVVAQSASAGLASEFSTSVRMLGLSIPAVIATSIFRGVLQAQERFDLTNSVQLPLSSLMYIGPFLISMWTTRLELLVVSLAVTRFVGALAMYILVRRSEDTPVLTTGSISDLAGLMRFGAWVTMASMVAPVLVYVDRFLVGALISISAVAFYVSAHDLMSRTWLVASSVMSVYFPAFAGRSSRTSGSRRLGYQDALQMMAGLSLPLCLTLTAFGHEILSLWLGADIADGSASVLRILSFGGFVAALALVPNMLLQATGKPKTVALVQLSELALYVGAFVVVAATGSIKAAALVWVIRAVGEAFALDRFAQRQVEDCERSVLLFLLTVGGAFLFVAASSPVGFVRVGAWALGVAVGAGYVMLSWMRRVNAKAARAVHS